MSSRSRPQETLGLPSRYTLHSLLGEGSSGRVYRVLDSARERELALKLVTPSESEWLRREFDTLRQIRHENLIQVFDWGALDSGEAYYTMELIEGEDWGRRTGRAQPPNEVRWVLTGLLRGLAHLHCHGEIHGDLKPGNILLGRGGVVKVTDVGMGASAAESSRLSGTPGYAAPEVWEGEKADARSDLYSVGVMAYEALTGVHPFAGRTVREVVSGQLEGWVPSPGVHGVRVPADLERVVMRSMERNAALRQGSADEFMEGMGVEDRIGEILGGRFVGREEELRRTIDLLKSNEPGRPTMLYVDGPQGIGKRAFVEEVAQRAVSSGAQVIHPELEQVASGQPVGTGVTIATEGFGATDVVSKLSHSADVLAKLAASVPTLIVDSLFADTRSRRFNRLRAIARYLWALSADSARPSRVLFIIQREESAFATDEFESSVQLQPYSIDELYPHIRGMLGTVDLEHELVRRLQTITGGNPGSLESVLVDLTQRKLLDRRDGIWRFRELEQIQSLEAPTTAKRWATSWDTLTEAGRTALTALALVSSSLTKIELSVATDQIEVSDTLTALRLRGWIREVADRWELGSEEIRRAVLSRASAVGISETGERLLTNTRVPLDREDRASLLLGRDPSRESLTEGIWAAEQSAARGDYRLALRRLDDCERVASGIEDWSSLRSVLLMKGLALHHLGQDDDALAAVGRHPSWEGAELDAGTSARRHHVLGVVYRAQGNYDLARRHFLECNQQAKLSQDVSTFLGSHAELAELEWRYGDEKTRREAMSRVRSALGSVAALNAAIDDRAALTYQLGAAMILAGERAEAERVLLEGVALEPGEFWRMRIATALGAATYYLGKFEASLQWLNEAWQCAEKSGFDAYKTRILSNRAGIYYALGRFRDSVDEHELSGKWARRTGSAYEYLIACSGGSVNLILIAQYERAIQKAREAREAALRLGNTHELAKAMEMEALCAFHIGDYLSCKRLLGEAGEAIQGLGFDDVKPRLDWLMARVLLEQSRDNDAEVLLLRAREDLSRTRDWEDLPGVEVELRRLRARHGDVAVHVAEIKRIACEAEQQGAVIVQLHAALAVAEILVASGLNDREGEDLVARSLARAEQVGAAELTWRLSVYLGEVAERHGTTLEAQTRYSQSLRSLREVADRLDPTSRHSYLQTSHALSALRRIAPNPRTP